MHKIFTLILITLWISVKSSLVTIDQGTLIGTNSTSRGGKLFNVFYGIPFAKPPLGPLRFKAPLAAGPWKGILDATQIPTGCLELRRVVNTPKGGEDCLNLNVYSPLNARRGDNLAVLFYIYGGIFKINNNLDHGPEYMMDRDIIIVIPNYRSGALGFLSTGDSVIPGNFGLKDQLLALKWTRQNIHHFGGNPNHITINGHSSGADCTHLHTLSPASKGLFHQVIIQSGTSFHFSGYWDANTARGIAEEFATKAGCPSIASSQAIYECLMSLEADIFPQIPEQMYIWRGEPDAVFRPSIEDKRVPDAFLTELPELLPYHSPNLPLMIGITTGESAPTIGSYLMNNGEAITEINQHSDALFPITLQYLWNTEPAYLDYISHTLRAHFFGDREIGFATWRNMLQLYSEGNFGVAAIEAIRRYSGPMYVYLYNYRANYSALYETGYTGPFLGVSHSDEVNLLFLTQKSINVLTKRDHIFSHELVKRWVNFIETSNPNYPAKINTTMMAHWQPMTSTRIEHLLINFNGTMKTDLYKDAYPFWRSLPIGSKYYKQARIRQFLENHC